MNVLEVQGLTKHYPAFTLNGVSFSVSEGAVMGFIGRNGAGSPAPHPGAELAGRHGRGHTAAAAADTGREHRGLYCEYAADFPGVGARL